MQKTARLLAGCVPDRHTFVYSAQLLGLILTCVLILAFVLPATDPWLPQYYKQILSDGTLLITMTLSLLVLAKLAVRYNWIAKLKGEMKLSIVLGGMIFEEIDLFTNMVIFGTIGSGKTRSAVYPILEQICQLYNDEDALSPRAKWGGLAADAKGDFHEAIIFTMTKHNRDVLKDLVIIRPDNDYYIVEFEETTTHDKFFVSATGGIQMQECNLVLKQAIGTTISTDSSGIKHLNLPNGRKESFNSFLFNDRKKFARPEVNSALKELEFQVKGLSIRWLGWREEKGRLVRVLRTVDRKVQYKLTDQGSHIYKDKPLTLKYVTAHYINNGLTYNLIAANIPSSEAAARIAALAELMGNSMGGDNAYWKMASHKHMTNCIELKRQVDGETGTECSINDIQNFTINETILNSYVVRLSSVVKRKEREGATAGEMQTLRNLENYFIGEWRPLDPKTRGNIISCVTNLFGDIPSNPQLLKTFCQPSKFSFDDCMNEGKVYTLVLNAYPNARKLVGTCMKLDFQQSVLKRMTAAPLNTNRFLMYMADENQFFFTTSGNGGDGDEDFMSIARQARIFNVLITQGVSSYLAVQKDENKIYTLIQNAACRVFFMNFDEKTNRLAEATAGQTYQEKLSASGPDMKLSHVFGESKSGSISRSMEKVNLYDHPHFGQMRPFEALICNGSRAVGPKVLKANLKSKASFWPKAEVTAAVNDYYQAFLENRAYELGIDYKFDCQDNLRLEDDHEKDLRNKGLLRSWQNGLPILTSPVTEATGDINPSENDIDPSNLGGDFKEEPADPIEQALGEYPTFDELKKYNSSFPLFSDLESSLSSDPFLSRGDKHTQTPNHNLEPNQPQNPPTTEPKTYEDGLVEALKKVTKPANRILANIIHVQDKPTSNNNQERDYPDRCIGTLLGVACGDILGANLEHRTREEIEMWQGRVRDFQDSEARPLGTYTDDTEMTLALATSLTECQSLDARHCASTYVRFFKTPPKRGYGGGASKVLDVLSEGADFRQTGTMFFPGGSYANGGVMRIAPVGLAFRHAQPEMLREAVRQALLPTHTHADAIDAACVQAYAIGILAKHTHGEIKPLDLLTLMESFATGSVLKQKLQQVKQALQSKSSAEELLKTICTPNLHGQAFQIHAAEALACSVWSFMTHWANPEEAIVEAVCLGGDCDTVGAITGALAGALHGSLWIPKRWLEPMENQPITGRNALIETACSLAKLDLTNVAAPK